MEKPKRLIELENLAKELDFSSDLLGNLEAEDGLVEVTLVNGEKLVGRSDFITWDGEDGLDRYIRFVPKSNEFEKGIYLKEDEILSYVRLEDLVPLRVYGFANGEPVEIRIDNKNL